jgi:transcriptional regulator with XRE-family HTH domain
MVKTLGSEIRRLRLLADITLRGFAKNLGHTAAHQCDIEHGRRMPSGDVLRRTVEALTHVGANYDELKDLDTRLDRDLEQWMQKNPAARALIRESKDSGRPVRELLQEFRERQEELLLPRHPDPSRARPW